MQILIQHMEIDVDGIAGKNPKTPLLKSVHIGEWCAGSMYATKVEGAYASCTFSTMQ